MASGDFFPLVRSWLTVHLPRARRLSPHTIRSYKTAIKTLLDYLTETRRLALADVTFDTIDRATITGMITWLLDTRAMSPASANQRLAAIKSFLSFCAGEDPALVAIWLDIKQIRPVKTPARPPDGLTENAVEALIKAPGQDSPRNIRDTVIMLLMFDAAARVQEILDLAIGDIDTTHGAGHVTLTGKGRKTRVVPIMDTTGRHLENYLHLFHPDRQQDGDALLFFTTRGGSRYPMSQDNVTYLLNKHADTARAGCPEIPGKVHAHQVRHARAMQMLRSGVPLPHIKEFLGHANIATTSIYATADNQMVRDAIRKAASTTPEPAPVWQRSDDMILQLAGIT